MLASAAAAAQPAPAAQNAPVPDAAVLAPPGLVPTLDECEQTPSDPRCAVELEIAQPLDMGWDGGRLWIFRGGFGQYFRPAGG